MIYTILHFLISQRIQKIVIVRYTSLPPLLMLVHHHVLQQALKLLLMAAFFVQREHEIKLQRSLMLPFLPSPPLTSSSLFPPSVNRIFHLPALLHCLFSPPHLLIPQANIAPEDVTCHPYVSQITVSSTTRCW